MSIRESNRDPLAIGIAVLGAAIQIGAWFYWSGKMETRLDAIEKRADQTENREATTAVINGKQDVSIAVITTQLSQIQSTVNSIDQKLQNP